MKNTPSLRLFSRLGLGLVSLGACNATYAPPVRSTHLRAPGRLAPGQGEIAATVGAPNGRGALGGGIPVTEALSVEAQFDTSDAWHVGNVGLRATHRSPDRVLSVDGEFGGGGGVGGQRCGNVGTDGDPCPGGAPDGRSAQERLAYGGFVGLGVGVRPVRWMALFARSRAQLTTANNVPNTLWISGLAGAEFLLGPVVVGAGAGYAHYSNDTESRGDLIVELGASVPFNVWGPQGRRAPLPPPAE